MRTRKMHIYWDKEGDFLEIRFGVATSCVYEKVGKDLFVKIDEKTGEKKGYAIFNIQKGDKSVFEVDIPLNLIKSLKSRKISI